MKKLIVIVFFAVSFSVNAQSHFALADSVILSKDSVTSYLTMVQLSRMASVDFKIETPTEVNVPFQPMYHWEKYVKNTYDNADSITCTIRKSFEYRSGNTLNLRTFKFWKDGELRRWIVYVFMGDLLKAEGDSNLRGYYSSEEEKDERVFKDFPAKRKL
jgi:hypothetical protein